MIPSSHVEAHEEARTSVLRVLSRLLKEETGVLAAARQLASLRFPLVGDTLDEDWRVFVGIDSETDHLPIGEEKKHWSAEALHAKNAEIEGAEAFYRSRALEAARRLILRYEKRAEPDARANGPERPWLTY